MKPYEVFVLIICLGTFFSFLNHRFLKLTPTVGIMALSLVSSLLVIATAGIFPDNSGAFIRVIKSIDFHNLLINGMLSFLLFAGSIHIDAAGLKKERMPVLILATVGIFISTFVIGGLMYLILNLFHLEVGFIYCLLFAALISPTDPIAVLAILKRAGIPKSLELKIAGESLLNDGVAVVVFMTILAIAQTGSANLSVSEISLLFLRQSGGGLTFGIIIGYLGYFAISSINKHEVEVFITISTVMGGYLLADKLHISGPLAMVAAGIVIGNTTKRSGVSDLSRDYLTKFWELIDELLNAVLFMMVGFEMLVIKMDMTTLIIGVISIVIVLLARWISVAIPITLLRYKNTFERNAIAILTWGGIRGGLSVALALSLSPDMHRDLFVSITYIVVVFSIIVQGLTIGKFYLRLG